MDSRRLPEVEKLFHEVVDETPATRARILGGADPSIAREVTSLLDAHEAPDPFDHSPLIGKRLGPYRIEREVGRGGMGTIYAAVRDDGTYTKTVAIKIIKRGMDTDAIVRRFVKERQILADLDHPHIARLLDAGSTDDGRPYYVMEYIDGQTLDRFADENNLQVAERLLIFRAICNAVDFAHRHGVIHRDLKPSNILVNASGLKLLDFGIAKVFSASTEDGTATMTGRGEQPMTPAYASPEQLAGRPVDVRTDVYSLGVVLHELLTGRRPDSTAGRHLDRKLRAILSTAVEREAGRRYASVSDLGRDIDSYLAGEPIAARTPGLVDRLLRRFRLRSPALRTDEEAVTLTLRARHIWNKRNPAEMHRAITLLQEAIERDPRYAPAHVAVADCYAYLGYMHLARPHVVFPKARAAATRAIELAPRLADAYATLAYIDMVYNWNVSAAETNFERGLRLQPKLAIAHHWHGWLLMYTERLPEARAALRRAIEIDPLVPIFSCVEAILESRAGNVDRAKEILRAILEVDPNNLGAHLYLGRVLEDWREPEEAIAHYRVLYQKTGGETETTGTLIHALSKNGGADEARMLRASFDATAKDRYVPPYFFALTDLGAGRYDEALTALEAAVEERNPRMCALHHDRRFEVLSGDSRFERVLDRIGMRPK